MTLLCQKIAVFLLEPQTPAENTVHHWDTFLVFLFRIEALKCTEEQGSALPMTGMERKKERWRGEERKGWKRKGGDRRGEEGEGGERRGREGRGGDERGGGTGGWEAERVREGSREKGTRVECKGSCFYPCAG